MKLNELLEARDYTHGKKNPELKIPVYTETDFDFGPSANNISTNDVIVKDTKTGDIFGRRQVKQRTITKSKPSSFKAWKGLKTL